MNINAQLSAVLVILILWVARFGNKTHGTDELETEGLFDCDQTYFAYSGQSPCTSDQCKLDCEGDGSRYSINVCLPLNRIRGSSDDDQNANEGGGGQENLNVDRVKFLDAILGATREGEEEEEEDDDESVLSNTATDGGGQENNLDRVFLDANGGGGHQEDDDHFVNADVALAPAPGEAYEHRICCCLFQLPNS